MTTFVTPFVQAVPRTGFDRLVNFIKAYRAYHETKHALSQLDDHMLRDIGVYTSTRDAADDLLRKTRASW